MGSLERFGNIIKANVSEVLSKSEDPATLVDQYLLELAEALASVKKETAGVLAEEARARRLMEENTSEIQRYDNLARKAVLAGNDGDARIFLTQKNKFLAKDESLKEAHSLAHKNAESMRKMHDKLVDDINTLQARKTSIKAKVAVANTQNKINSSSPVTEKTKSAMTAFERMEEKADQMLDQANAMEELNRGAKDSLDNLKQKYDAPDPEVEEELERLKREL